MGKTEKELGIRFYTKKIEYNKESERLEKKRAEIKLKMSC